MTPTMTLQTTAERPRDLRALCMPVGPVGIKPSTAQMAIALVRCEAIDMVIMHESHLIPARNKCWHDAVAHGVRKVLWLDADIYADPGETIEFMKRSDSAFDVDATIAWIGAVCARRGGGWAMQTGKNETQYPLLMGLGLAYWHVERMRHAFDHEDQHAFVWVPPFGEDYAAGCKVWDAGLRVVADTVLATAHDGVGEWRGVPQNGA